MDLEAIRSRPGTVVEQRYDRRDTMLYALGVGFGADPLDLDDLHFVYESRLKASPSMCCVLAQPHAWLEDPVFNIDWVKVLHAEQAFTIHRPIQACGHLRGESRILAVEDRGPGRGALLLVQKSLRNAVTDELHATVNSVLLLRGDGGLGGFGERIEVAPVIAARDPDRSVQYTTPANAALLYRLNGDYNPLHADPALASQAGFTKPILHGLCTYGIACRAILATYCDHTPARLSSLSGRFSAPVYPGETLRFEFYESPDGLRFKARALERNVIVLDRGRASIAD